LIRITLHHLLYAAGLADALLKYDQWQRADDTLYLQGEAYAGSSAEMG
jgi:hypothetical protein